MFFWNSLAFSMIPWMLAIWSRIPLPFLNPACTSGSSQFMYCWSLAWRILSITLLAWKMSTTVGYFEHSLALPFFRTEMKTDIFQSYGHYWAFQIWWHIECSTFTASSFRIWHSSAVIQSPSLALFIVMLPKACLTSHSRMSGSRWVTTPLWLSRSLRPFLYSSSVYSCHLFLISSASVRSLPFLMFIVPILAWNVPLISPIFLKRSLVLPILLFSYTALHCLLKETKVKIIQSCLTLCNSIDCTVHGILQARILEWVAIPFSKRSSQPRDQTQVSRMTGRFFTSHQGSPRMLEWVAYSFSSGSSQPRNWTRISCIAGRFFTSWTTID